MANWIVFTRAHCAIYRGTRGLIGGRLMGIQMLLLTTKGRKTGRDRTLPLAYVEYRGDLVIVASNGGSPHPPAWWLNLQAAETARVQIAGERFEVRWQTAPRDQRMEYWRKLQAAIPAYRIYRVRTDREIPIVLLRRAEASWQTRPLQSAEAPNPTGAPLVAARDAAFDAAETAPPTA